ncbi:alpha/beta fold hydrolase [Bradyrhizobium lablabi]|uniref:alpha/beta fold hydrolase n=1 Tax=Bradyrhizobium lablabi TaxID=722472 RepID=UPI001BA77E61|nr:alpha/beta hydrolase [Bradyrhizobium lablabi]MBR0694019.1 alpha/beta hydrolase [Bradyrhizobium lablabi]
MSPIVLVHGAWQGGWAWRLVKPLLVNIGRTVHAPTLTGLGERSGTADPPGLSEHIQDICRVIEFEELENVVLVGHSYAGMVITGVADHLRDRIGHLVYLDAAVPADGDDFASAIPKLPQERAEARRQAFRSMAPDGDWLPPPQATLLGIRDPAIADWVERRSTPHPLRSWLEPLHFKNGGHSGISKTYVLATEPATEIMGYPAHAAVARQGGDWTYRDIRCGHQMQALRPDETARIIAEAI